MFNKISVMVKISYAPLMHPNSSILHMCCGASALAIRMVLPPCADDQTIRRRGDYITTRQDDLARASNQGNQYDTGPQYSRKARSPQCRSR
jgi:hypothetical protein